jgi:hypothetical protein
MRTRTRRRGSQDDQEGWKVLLLIYQVNQSRQVNQSWSQGYIPRVETVDGIQPGLVKTSCGRSGLLLPASQRSAVSMERPSKVTRNFVPIQKRRKPAPLPGQRR